MKVVKALLVYGTVPSFFVAPYTSGVTPFCTFEAVGCILGLFFGSFLNVCIARIPRGESIVKPRSHCPRCGALIHWYDNIPVLSWLFLRGRCRSCKAAIAWQYPLVEIAVALWFMAVIAVAQVGISGQLTAENYASFLLSSLGLATLGFLLIGLMVMDWQTMLLPDAFTFTGIAIAFLFTCVRAFLLAPAEGQVILDSSHELRLSSPGSFAAQGNVFLTGPERMLGGWLVATMGAAAILLVIRWLYRAIRHREGMGLGDTKLLALIAAFLGFWPAVLSLFLGVLLASTYAIFLLARGRAGATTRLAFGSFLCAGGLITALFGTRLIDTYQSFLR